MRSDGVSGMDKVKNIKISKIMRVEDKPGITDTKVMK
jgi:hypothetical protein